jgi:Protein of unknown function (DUF3667)
MPNLVADQMAMTDEITAIGDVATGAVLGVAAEPSAGHGEASGTKICLNCGGDIAGSHCHSCGQKARVHRSLAAFGHDIIHGVLHLDGKIWRTLPMLAWRPGELTRRYIDGERAKFVSPIALFLFCVFLSFAVFNTIDVNMNFDGDSSISVGSVAKEPVTPQILESRAPRAEVKIDMFGNETLNAAAKEAVKNPQLLLYKVQSNAYKFSWALIPLSVPFIWLLFFWRREYQLFDHAVFATYSLCFMMVLSSLCALILSRAAEGSFLFVIAVIALLVLPLFHIYRHVRGTYLTSRGGAVWRTCALSMFALIALSAFMTLIVMLGITG